MCLPSVIKDEEIPEVDGGLNGTTIERNGSFFMAILIARR